MSVTVFDQTSSLVGSDDGDGNSDITIRQVIPASALSAGVGGETQFRVTVLFGTGQPTVTAAVTDVFGGRGAASGNAWSFQNAPTRVTFSSGSSSINGSASSSQISDWVTLPETFDNTKPFVIAYHCSATVQMNQSLAGPVGYLAPFESGNDASTQTTGGGYTANVNTLVFIAKIEIQTASTPAIATLGAPRGTIFVPSGRARGPTRGLSAIRAFADPIIIVPTVPAIQIGRSQGFLFRPGSGVTWDIKRRSAFPDAAGGISVTVNFGGSFEFTSGVRSDGLAVLEYLASIRADSTAQMEAIAAVRSDDSVLPELVAGLSANVASQLEFLGSMRADNLGPLEIAAAFRSDVIALMEALSGQRSDAAMAGEIMASLRADLVGPLENLGAVNVISDGAVQIETTAAVRSDSVASMEMLPSVRRDTPAPIEETAGSSMQAGVLTETTGAVRSDSTSQIEMGGTLRADAAISAETIGSVTSQSVATMENTAGVARDAPVPQESLGGLSVIFSSALQLEFLGVAVNSAIEWILRARRRHNR